MQEQNRINNSKSHIKQKMTNRIPEKEVHFHGFSLFIGKISPFVVEFTTSLYRLMPEE